MCELKITESKNALTKKSIILKKMETYKEDEGNFYCSINIYKKIFPKLLVFFGSCKQ